MVKQLVRVQRVMWIVALAAAAACGGKQGATLPDERGDSDMPPAADDPPDGSASMVPPEKMDEITRMLQRKQRIVSRCLADAVDRDELPKNSRGRMSLDIVISPSGKTSSVKVIKSSLESRTLEACVIGHVQEIQFPSLPKPYPTSYTYAFEAM